MNTILTFLECNRQRLELERYGASTRLSYVVVTPQFETSSRVVFLVLAEGKPDPVLAVKVPRLAGVNASVEREVTKLWAVQATRPGGFDSIPRVVTFEEYHGRLILVETALVGQPMDPNTVRRDPVRCCDTVKGWLADIQETGRYAANTDRNWFERLVERPLCYIADVFPQAPEDATLLERTWELVAPLRETNLPLLLEHGDLSYPNILLLKDGATGVVDWELAEPRGLPACDLFFFLTYVAFALHKAYASGDYLSAFHAAFFGRTAWARSYVTAYAAQWQLPLSTLTPLFVLCWARYTESLLRRLMDTRCPQEPLGPDTAAWLRAYRYPEFWRYTLAHVHDLNWYGASTPLRARPRSLRLTWAKRR